MRMLSHQGIVYEMQNLNKKIKIKKSFDAKEIVIMRFLASKLMVSNRIKYSSFFFKLFFLGFTVLAMGFYANLQS